MTHAEYLNAVGYMLFEKGKELDAKEICRDCGELSNGCSCLKKTK